MSTPTVSSPGKAMASILSKDRVQIDDAIASLAKRLGQADFISELLPFDYTDYYDEELGAPLLRRFVAFEQLVEVTGLPDLKLFTNTIEEQGAIEGRRRVNVDPGYIVAERLVLATGKNYTHRVYLGQGIYADLTLIYVKNHFQPLPWTYPDYASEKTRTILGQIRKKYLFQLKNK